MLLGSTPELKNKKLGKNTQHATEYGSYELQGRGRDLLWVFVLQHYESGTVNLPSAQQPFVAWTVCRRRSLICKLLLWIHFRSAHPQQSTISDSLHVEWMQINSLLLFWLQMYNKYKNSHLFLSYLDDYCLTECSTGLNKSLRIEHYKLRGHLLHITAFHFHSKAKRKRNRVVILDMFRVIQSGSYCCSDSASCLRSCFYITEDLWVDPSQSDHDLRG